LLLCVLIEKLLTKFNGNSRAGAGGAMAHANLAGPYGW
jgi:hypothetical protein